MNRHAIKKRLVALAAFSLQLAACSGNMNPNGSPESYAGPGSHYVAQVNGANFKIDRYASVGSASPTFSVKGSTQRIFGFLKLSVSEVTGTNGPSVGDEAYGIDVPGLALFVKPLDTSNPDQVMAAVKTGQCPNSSFTANWVIVKQTAASNVSNASTDSFGTFAYDGTANTASVSHRYSLANTATDLGANNFASASCSDGIMQVSNGAGDTAVMYLTSGGGAIVNTAATTAANASFIFGLPVKRIDPARFAGTYSGFRYKGGSGSGNKFKPIKMVLDYPGTLTGTGYHLTDPSTDTVGTETTTITLSAINSPSDGLMTGNLTVPGGGTTTIACMGVENANGSGKQIINCAGADPSSASKLFNFLIVSR